MTRDDFGTDYQDVEAGQEYGLRGGFHTHKQSGVKGWSGMDTETWADNHRGNPDVETALKQTRERKKCLPVNCPGFLLSLP